MDTYTIQRQILKMELLPAEKLIGMALSLHVNAETGLIRVRQDTIAKMCGYSTRTVKRAVKALVDAGVFESKRTGRSSILNVPQGKETGRVEVPSVSPQKGRQRHIGTRKKSMPWDLDTALSTPAEERHKREERRARREEEALEKLQMCSSQN